MMQNSLSNPALAGITQGEVILTNEKSYHTAYEAYYICAPRCITHFGEDGIPYHSGEKSCLDRCMAKLKVGMELALETKKQFQKELSEQRLPYRWMQQVANNEVEL